MVKKFLAIGGAVLVVASLGLFVVGTAFAQDPTPTRQPAWGRAWGGIRQGATVFCDAVAELLGLTPEELSAEREAGKSLREVAAKQGLDEEELKEALADARAEKLEQAVADGKITQEQADRMAEWAPMGPRDRRRGAMRQGVAVGRDTITELLDLTPEELSAEREAGKSLREIAAKQGLDEEDLKESLADTRAEKLAQTVADGKITQEQADRLMERKRAPIGPHGFGRGGRGAVRGFRRGSAPSDS